MPRFAGIEFDGIKEAATRQGFRRLLETMGNMWLEGTAAQRPTSARQGAFYTETDGDRRVWWWSGDEAIGDDGWLQIHSETSGGPPTVLHEELTDLLGGGGVPDKHYHLDLADWTALTDAHAQLAALQTDAGPTFDHIHVTNNAAVGSLNVATFAVAVEAACALNQDLTTDSAVTFKVGNFTGWGPAGTGAHIGYVGGKGELAAYDYVGSAYLDLKYDALTHTWFIGNTAKMALDVSGLTVVGAVNLGESASFEFPNSAAPTVDAEGEAAWETDRDLLLMYDGTRAVAVGAGIWKISASVMNPTSGLTIPLMECLNPITITQVDYFCVAGTSVLFKLWEYSSALASEAQIDTAGFYTATTSRTSDSSIGTNATLDAGDYLYLTTSTVTGLVTCLHVDVYFYVT